MQDYCKLRLSAVCAVKEPILHTAVPIWREIVRTGYSKDKQYHPVSAARRQIQRSARTPVSSDVVWGPAYPPSSPPRAGKGIEGGMAAAEKMR